MGSLTVGSLFYPEPVFQASLRGDGYLWPALAAELSDVPLPQRYRPWETVQIVEDAFERVTGQPLAKEPEYREFIRVEKVDHGGMSGGGVSVFYWRWTYLPIIVDRWLHAVTPPAPID